MLPQIRDLHCCMLIAALIQTAFSAADEIGVARTNIADAQAKYDSYSAETEMMLGSKINGMSSAAMIRVKRDRFAMQVSAIVQGYKQNHLIVKDAAGFVWDEQEEDGQKSITKRTGDNIEGLDEFPLAIATGLLDALMPGQADLKAILSHYARYFDFHVASEVKLHGVDAISFEGPMKDSVKKSLESAVAADSADTDKGPTAETIGSVFRMAADLKRIRIVIAKEDGLPRLIEAFGSDDKPTMRQTFKNIVIRASIEDKVFVYSPPPGERVVELRY